MNFFCLELTQKTKIIQNYCNGQGKPPTGTSHPTQQLFFTSVFFLGKADTPPPIITAFKHNLILYYCSWQIDWLITNGRRGRSPVRLGVPTTLSIVYRYRYQTKKSGTGFLLKSFFNRLPIGLGEHISLCFRTGLQLTDEYGITGLVLISHGSLWLMMLFSPL